LVFRAELDAELEKARKAGSMSRMQALLAEKTALLAAIYDRPKQGAAPRPAP
jgi:hypothetical protein